MRLWARLLYLLPWKRKEEDRELDAELQSIVDLATDDLGSANAVRRALGNLTLAKEDARAVSQWAWLESMIADVQYAFRVLRREPSFTAIAVISLALCIGANVAIFSLVDAVLVRMLPVYQPERLVVLESSTSSYFAWQQFSARSGEWMSGILGSTTAVRDVNLGGGPFRGSVELVTGNYFDVLGVPASHGRMITAVDDRREDPASVVVLSQPFWRRHFAGDGSVLGRDRLLAFLAGSFGALALMIAAVGIYGLLSYEIAKRTNEIGIRMALGATRWSILAMVLRDVLLVCAVGVTLGATAALACSKLVESIVFGIEPRHPLVLSTSAAVLVLVALAAAWVPARRAASVNPMLALRHE